MRGGLKLSFAVGLIALILVIPTGSIAFAEQSSPANIQVTGPQFALYGIIGATLLFVITGYMWRERLRAVRKTL